MEPADLDAVGSIDELVQQAMLLFRVEPHIVMVAADRVGVTIDLLQREAKLQERVPHDLQSALQLRMDHILGAQLPEMFVPSSLVARAMIGSSGDRSRAALTINAFASSSGPATTRARARFSPAWVSTSELAASP